MDLYWVDSTLAVASRPRGGDWLDDEMADIRRQGIDVLVSCLLPSEEKELDLTAESQAAKHAGIAFVRTPIEDRGTPTDPSAFAEVVNRLSDDRRAGRHVAIHCRQGLGRSPLVAAALLVRSGQSPDEAWALVAERRRQSVPDTDEQRDWIRSFARSATGHPS